LVQDLAVLNRNETRIRIFYFTGDIKAINILSASYFKRQRGEPLKKKKKQNMQLQ
jgi:hypothetical protein